MKKILIFSCALILATSVQAKKFSDAPAGQGQSFVGGASPDYATLDQAAKDFSGTPGGCTGDWTLLVASDLAEPNNVAFGNATNGFKVTVKPAPSTQPIITFTTTTAFANTIWAGHLLVGTTSTQNLAVEMTPTENFTIDGSNTAGGTTRDMKITNLSTNSNASYLVRYVGASGNATVKNLVLDQQSSGSAESFCVEFTAKRDAANNDWIPTTCTVNNCLMKSKLSANGQAVVARKSPPITAGKLMTALNFSNNDCEVTHRGFFMDMGDGTVDNNRCSIDQTFVGSGNRSDFFEHNGNSGTGWTVNFTNNKLLKQRNVNLPGIMSGIFIGGGIASPQTGTYNIVNNTFGGYDFSDIPTTTAASLIRAITVQGTAVATSVTCNVNIFHNSINLPNFPNIQQPGNVDRYNAFAFNQGQFTGSIVIKNNIVRAEQFNGVLIWKVGGAVGTFESDYNIFYIGKAGAKFAGYNVANGTHVSNINTFEDWKLATGQDAHSYAVVNPAIPAPPAPGKWVSASDLHFTGDPGSVYLGTPVGVATDIDGQARSTTAPVIGADELAILINVQASAAQDWQLFE